MKSAAIYARVSSDKQKALIEFARDHGYRVPDAWIFEDEGYSGASLVRPGLERVRDLAAEGQLHAILVYAPDRLSRNTRTRSSWSRSSPATVSRPSLSRRRRRRRRKISCCCSSRA